MVVYYVALISSNVGSLHGDEAAKVLWGFVTDSSGNILMGKVILYRALYS